MQITKGTFLTAAALAVCFALSAGGFACAPAAPAAPVKPVASSASPAPTLAPAPTPTPVPTPKITDAWYVARTEEMRHNMALYGGYAGEALDARVRDMEIDPDKPMIALTFDDGPVAGVTDEIVRILASYNCRATFFTLGSRVRNDATPGLWRAILGEGNEIGNHTWQHLNLKTANGNQIFTSIRKTNEAVYDATGYTVRLLRPPGGNVNGDVDYYARRLGMPVILWAQSGNAFETDPEKIAQNVEKQLVNGKALEDGDIVLLHDTNVRMVEAVAIMTPRLIAAGYQLVTVSELLRLSEGELQPGMRYSRQNP